ncbi:regulator of (H+)-ATPase in vacuolar membrane [Mortierella alpina]|uniref:Regulator of (H+)-ATPase in vacuolar membrane n=1 Tax=Mortierella alpina TaxID=64518 RepID=A0A9P6M5Z8_MORAP|nr:regulator of (H+)-ATPase in vacuolar membrane [Mortierella alpina]
MLLQQVCPGKTCGSLQSIHSVSYKSRRYILYAATDSVVVCDASFKPIQILFLQEDAHESQNQVVNAVVMSEFDGKIAVTTRHHVLVYAPKPAVHEGEKVIYSLEAGILHFGTNKMAAFISYGNGDSTASEAQINVLFTMARDGICRIWSPLILLQPESMSICAIIDPSQWVVSQQQTTTQYPIHALDGMEFAMAVEYAASKTVDKSNDANSIRLRKLKELVRDTSDLFFQIQGDGSMVIWGVQASASPADVVIVGQSREGRWKYNGRTRFETVVDRPTEPYQSHREGPPATLLYVSRGPWGHFALEIENAEGNGHYENKVLLAIPARSHADDRMQFGHRVAAGLVEIGSLPIGARNVQLVTPAWEESFAGTLPKSLHSTHMNVFTTYSKEQGNISYWECGHDFHAHKGDRQWQRAERIPTKDNLKFFQCGANGKLALVYENGDETCDLEIWGSAGGRATARLESSFTRLGSIYDLDWMVTADARHNLAVAFRSTVSMYSQQRTTSVTSPPIWGRFLDINIPASINHPISAIAWLDMGTLSVGAGGTMLLYGKWLSEDYMTIASGFEDLKTKAPTLHHALSSMHGPLVDYHPNLLIEFFMWGKFEVVRKILFNLYHYMTYVNESGDFSTGPLPIPLEVILKTDVAAKPMRADHNDLFMTENDFKNADENKFLNLRTSQEMIEFLTRVPLADLSKSEQLQLSAFIEGFTMIDEQRGSIDDNGLRFLIFVRQFNYFSYILPPMQRPTMLSYSDIVWAYHSESQDLLLDFCSSSLKAPMKWADAKSLGIFLWMRKKDTMIKQMEIIARNEYMGIVDKDPVACTLFYIALKKKKLLHGLWRTSHGHPEQGKMVAFLANDFEQDRWKTAALKNAFALLGKQRFAYAAAFFLLADKLQDAVNVCMKQLNDLQKNTPNAANYEGEEEFSAVVRAAEAYEHYGCPLLSLVILKHWGYVMPVDTNKEKEEVRNILQVRRDSIVSLPKSTSMSFMGGFKGVEAPNTADFNSGVLSFGDSGTTKSSGMIAHGGSLKQELPKSNSMSMMGGFKSAGPPPDVDSGVSDFDSFGGGAKKPNGQGMSLMGGFKKTAPPSDIDSGVLDFDSFGSLSNKRTDSPSAAPKPASMSLMGGFKSTTSTNLDSGMLDFGAFDGMNSTTKSHNTNPTAKARDIFAEFAPPAENGMGRSAAANGFNKDEDDEAGSGSDDDDKVRGTEELLNDYITTLVVQLLTPMASALRTVSLKPELLVTPVFRGYVENTKYGWDKLSEHANVSSVVMEQALISKCIEVDTLSVCFHWLNTTMSTGSPISAIVSHYSESCYSMVGIVLTERLTSCMKSHIKEYARSVLESSSEWFSLAKTVIKADMALPRWEQMVLASYIMLVIMSLQEENYAVLSGMLFQWRRFSGFVVGDRGGAVQVISEVLKGNLYSPLDANTISSDIKDKDGEKSERETLQAVLLHAATTNALVMSLEGLLRDHGHRMSDETRRFISSSFLDRLTRSGVEQEKNAIGLMRKSPLQDHLRGYLNTWQKKYWVLLSGLESGGHLLPLVCTFLESQRQSRDSPLAPVDDTTLLYKTRSVITSFNFNPVEKRVVAVCSRSEIVEVDISKSLDFQRTMGASEADQSDMESDMDIEEEDLDLDAGDFLDAQGNVIDHSVSTSKAPSVIATESSAEDSLSRVASQASLQNMIKNIFQKGAKHPGGHHHHHHDPVHSHHHHGLVQAVTDSNLRRSQGLAPGPFTPASGAKSNEPSNTLLRADVIATCSESHPSFPLYLTGHNPDLNYPCVTLWQFGQPNALNNYSGTSSKVTRVHFDAHGQKFGATDVKGDLHLWRFDSNTIGSKPFLSLTCHDKTARDFAFLGSSSVIATTGTSGDGKNLAIWDTLLPKEKAQTKAYKVHDRGGGYSLAYSKRHQLLVSGGRNGEICIFDIRQPRLLHTIQAHDMHVRSLYIDDAGLTLCSGSGEGDMKAWNLETFEQLSSFENLQARNRFQLQTFDRIPVKAYGVAQIMATDDYYYTCGPTGLLRAKRK